MLPVLIAAAVGSVAGSIVGCLVSMTVQRRWSFAGLLAWIPVCIGFGLGWAAAYWLLPAAAGLRTVVIALYVSGNVGGLLAVLAAMWLFRPGNGRGR